MALLSSLANRLNRSCRRPNEIMFKKYFSKNVQINGKKGKRKENNLLKGFFDGN
jgi:hypothetical protein